MSEIEKRLNAIEQVYNVEILYACEAGSRAWGFESKTSDYDVRFIYRHPTFYYKSLWEPRDVINLQVPDHNLDLSGWDLRKALRLGYKGNPSLIEWLRSPILYRTKTLPPRISWWDLAGTIFKPKVAMHHYFYMARKEYNKHISLKNEVSLKKYLYVIRALLAVRHISQGRGVPPVPMEQLIHDEVEAGLDLTMAQLIRQTVCHKKASKMKTVHRSKTIDLWIDMMLSSRQLLFGAMPNNQVPALAKLTLNKLYRKLALRENEDG